MNKRLLMDLSMFDGTDGSPAETGGIADHTSESQTEKKPQVLYGKQDTGNSEGDSRSARPKRTARTGQPRRLVAARRWRDWPLPKPPFGV